MQAEQFYQDVLEGVIAKLKDSNKSSGIHPKVIENLREVSRVVIVRFGLES